MSSRPYHTCFRANVNNSDIDSDIICTWTLYQPFFYSVCEIAMDPYLLYAIWWPARAMISPPTLRERDQTQTNIPVPSLRPREFVSLLKASRVVSPFQYQRLVGWQRIAVLVPSRDCIEKVIVSHFPILSRSSSLENIARKGLERAIISPRKHYASSSLWTIASHHSSLFLAQFSLQYWIEGSGSSFHLLTSISDLR